MSFLDWLTESKAKYTVLELKPEKLKDFINYFPGIIRQCYISDEDIERSMQSAGLKSELDEKRIIAACVPDLGSVMAGDFGEIVSHFLLIERSKPEPMEGLLKWRWKEDRNKPMQKTDVVLYKVGKKPSPDDVIIAAESKAKATSNAKYDPVGVAIIGAKKDITSRLAKSLSWLKDRADKDGDIESSKKLSRFIDSQEENFGPYQKYHKAIIFIDANLINSEPLVDHDISDMHNFEILVVVVPNLKETYQAIFDNIQNYVR